MGQPQVAKKTYTIEEWLALEEETGERYEYHFGEIFSVSAMAGGSMAHTRISRNALVNIDNHFTGKKKNCEVFSSEAKIQVNTAGRYVYPDTLAVCGDVEESEKVKGAILNPILVIEVVSDSSEAYDRGAKFRYYRRLPSVKEYLILEQVRPAATVYRRQGNGDIFSRYEYEGLEATVALTSIDLELPLGRFYRNVEFSDLSDEVAKPE
ncbi:MAG: Uma2 family endonuclease [Bacteroidota bacterium]